MFLLVLQAASTVMMTGLIWFVQIVHYPLFTQVGEVAFPRYAAVHATRTTWVVAPLMFLELGSAGLLLISRFRPAFISPWQAWMGAALVGLIWSSTAFLQVPLHTRLQAGFLPADAIQLVRSNWIRTVAWTVRAALVLAWIHAGLASRSLQ